MIDEYNIKYITAGLHTQRVGRWLRLYQQVGSTNQIARQLIESEGAPDGGMVISEYQSSGRGRLGRRWLAPPRSSILASFILRPDNIAATQALALTMCLAGAARAAIRRLYPNLDAQLKWPNDIMVNEAKLGGILSEVSFAGGIVSWAVLGLGLNVNISKAELIGLSAIATSLSAELGHQVDRTTIFCAICDELEPRYLRLQAGDYPVIWREWADSLCWYGREVSVSAGDDVTLVGKLLSVEQDGTLVVQSANGASQRVMVGDLSLRLRLGRAPHAPTTMAGCRGVWRTPWLGDLSLRLR